MSEKNAYKDIPIRQVALHTVVSLPDGRVAVRGHVNDGEQTVTVYFADTTFEHISGYTSIYVIKSPKQLSLDYLQQRTSQESSNEGEKTTGFLLPALPREAVP